MDYENQDLASPAWTPTVKQAEFLRASEDEVLYGGGAGAGKTDALIIDALGPGGESIKVPEYRGLILRRTYPELKEIVDRTREIYPRVDTGSKFVESPSPEWRFSSGARVELGYLDRDSDVMRYQSRQFQWLGWEELAQWASPYCYEYMLSRLRAPSRFNLKCFVRATCNPDGPGARWIAERWGINPAGYSCSREIDIEGRIWRRRFIQSRLDDNPHLKGTGYREKLLMLPDEIRRALLEGRWDEPTIGGAIYGEALGKARQDGRVCAVPHDQGARVDTAWDLGMADSTSIWFSQTIGKEVRLIRYYEASGEGLPYYVTELDRLARTEGYLYGRHVAPHDIRVREMGTGKSRLEVAAKLGIAFEVAPDIGLEDGIHAARMLFPRLWIDHVNCRSGLEALTHYRRTFNKSLGEYRSTPVHDWSSHAADALRYLAVSRKDAGTKFEEVRARRGPNQRTDTGWMAY